MFTNDCRASLPRRVKVNSSFHTTNLPRFSISAAHLEEHLDVLKLPSQGYPLLVEISLHLFFFLLQFRQST